MLRRPFSVHVFLYRREPADAYQFMLLRRTPREAFGLPAFWQGITGALLEGETFLEGAEREVREETGLEGMDIHFTGFVANYPIRPAWRAQFGEGPDHVEEHAACAEVPANAQPALSGEHSEWGWFAAGQATELLDTGHNLESFNSVLERLTPRKPRRR
jgi:8-oxo-dGTP pyrophosphatase MutT (NUDIX family)